MNFSFVLGIEVRFRGAARAKWNETVQNGPHRTDIEHEKEEIYFDDRFCLWGRGMCELVCQLIIFIILFYQCYKIERI